MRSLFAFIFVAIVLTSCSTSPEPVQGYSTAVTPTLRCKVLENNTISYVTLNYKQKITTRFLDTVWVNLSTHTIDDTSSNTMKAVLYYN